MSDQERDIEILTKMYGEQKDTRPEPYKLPFIKESVIFWT